MATVRYLVSDVERSRAFYRDVLGFEDGFDMLPAFAMVRHGDLALWLAGPASSAARPMHDGRAPQPGGWNRFVLEVADLDAAVARLRAAGAALRNDIIKGPGGRQILVDDPDGNPIELFEAGVTEAGFSKSEMMIVAAARELAGQHVCFVGVGLPNIAVNLAKRTVAPDLELVYEAGVFGARPARLPLSIGDPTIVTGATAVVSMFELFAFYLQRGLIDVGFLGAAQIDKFGNLNSTVIGDYDAPTTRLPGSGGACEIAINARNVFVIMRQSSRSFVERIDFRTSPGNLGGAEQAEKIRRAGGWQGRGPSVVVTDLGIWHFDETGEMRLDFLHPGSTLDQVRATIAWDPRIADDLGTTPPPTAEELRLVREELDPGGVYTK